MKLAALLLALASPLAAQSPSFGMYLPNAERVVEGATQRQLAGLALGIATHTPRFALSASFVPSWIAEHAASVRDIPAGVLLAEGRVVEKVGHVWLGVGVGAVHRWSEAWKAWEYEAVGSVGVDFSHARFEAVAFGVRQVVVRAIVGPSTTVDKRSRKLTEAAQ